MLKALYDAIRNDAPAKIYDFEGGIRFADKEMKPVFEPKPKAICVTSLTGIVDYLNTNVDGLERKDLICHVISPSAVAVFSKLRGSMKQRDTYILADLDRIQIPLNDWIEAEKFNIILQSCFVDPDDPKLVTDRAKVLRYIANIKSVSEAGISDDGTQQAVTIRKNIASVENSILPNPVTLRPWRTFPEVEQPASNFVFRAKSDANGNMFYLLVEADGGAWTGEAMKNIKEYMEANVRELNVIA